MQTLYSADKYIVFYNKLQTDYITSLPPGQQTFAILAEAFGVDVYLARIRLFPDFIKKKRDWIQDVSSYLLNIKKRALDDYLEDFLRPDMPLDEIGILLFARMMHKHVVVFFNEIWWTTRSDCEYKADCYLIYRGKCQFSNTIPLTAAEWDARKDYLTSFGKHYFDILKEQEEDDNSILQSTTDDTTSDPNQHSTTDNTTTDPNQHSTMDNTTTDPNLHSTNVDDTEEPNVQSTTDSTKEHDANNNCTVQEETKNVTSDKDEPDDEELLNEVETSFNVEVQRKKRTKKDTSGEPVRRSKRLQDQDDRLTDSMLSNLNNVSGRTRSSTASTPSDSAKPKPRTTRNSNKSAASIPASNKVAKTAKNKGNFNYKNFQLKKPTKKKKPKKCSSCPKLCDTYKDLADHVKEAHPEYKYKCRYCPKTFNSSSWKYQHQARHKGLQYQCGVEECSKLFQFAYQLRDHMKKHTGDKLYVCSTRKCGKGFTTKRARTYHEQSHSLSPKDVFTCDYKESDTEKACGKKFQRKNLLTQHRNGHFGKKYVTYCGKVYNWPNARKYHQDNCDLCKEIKEKRRLKYKKKK